MYEKCHANAGILESSLWQVWLDSQKHHQKALAKEVVETWDQHHKLGCCAAARQILGYCAH